LKHLAGDVGENQKPGTNKTILWDAFSEIGPLEGMVRFKIVAEVGNLVKPSATLPKKNPDSVESGIFFDKLNRHAYAWVKIGRQVWMAENLRATEYNDGTDLQEIPESKAWEIANTEAYCRYKNKKQENATLLYNWAAVRSGKLCPAGWHIPGNEDWLELETCLGGDLIAGGKLKSAKGWGRPITGENNSGFSALPEGKRLSDGNYTDAGDTGNWWTSTPYGEQTGWFRSISFESAAIFRYI